MGPTTRLDESIYEPFSERIYGPVLRPGDDGYDEARTVWNAMIDRDRRSPSGVRGPPT